MGKQIKLRRRGKGGMLYMVRDVPVRYRSVESRAEIWVNLNTDVSTLAQQKAPGVWSDLIAGWEAKLDGNTADAEKAFDAAQRLAKARGYRWLTAGDVAGLPRHELLERVEAVRKPNGNLDTKEAAALLGGAKEPEITVNRALELFWEYATTESTRGASEDQIRRWKNPRIKAIRNFIGVVGDKVLAAITRDDMLDFRDWWSKRIENEDMSPGSANKDIGYVENTLRLVNEKKRLGLNLPFGKLTFKEDDDEDSKRHPFSEKWIAEKLMAQDAMSGMNDEARDVVLAMVNTGMRPSEIVGLLPQHIHLDGPVPYVEIKAEGKKTKNKPSRRFVPLVGVSLAAMKRHPEGFPTYRFKDRISDTANKFLRENGLLETEVHTLYGLRHAFEDRMLAAKIDERIRRDLMGHSLGGRQRYGDGAPLATVRKLLAKIAH
ncbi:tyrosine-type recombinase/integrase [Mesorhizobium sp. BH1-1-4]|uniref:tyrosine-type recombinase/integrase n=1 Tax=Mesorhizobium sp. BH1-1-4 TaxID=2876662 RepID=UPI001CD0D9CB|nr:tyrosine-type recombinase/integrase [Mesorhizobium sp. BH1-1-4]MBZ9996594.1 tyrosine-type recombinase/integrase [Mesorhizobium sp. BH1-1-4]